MSMLIEARIAAVLVCGVLAASLGCQQFDLATAELEQEFNLPADDLQRLSVFNSNGEVRVSPLASDEDRIEVRATVHAAAASEEQAQAAAESVEILSPRSSGDAAVQELRWQGGEGAARLRVSFNVRVPPRLAISVDQHNGACHVSGVQGDVHLQTRNGAVRVIEAARGKLHVETHNGEIQVRSPAESVHLHTHNGAVRATLSSPLELSGEISTHNGGVRVSLTDDVSCDVSCETHQGAVHAQGFALDSSGRRSWQGRVGAGGKRLSISTHNGDVTLDRDVEDDAATDAEDARHIGPSAQAVAKGLTEI